MQICKISHKVCEFQGQRYNKGRRNMTQINLIEIETNLLGLLRERISRTQKYFREIDDCILIYKTKPLAEWKDSNSWFAPTCIFLCELDNLFGHHSNCLDMCRVVLGSLIDCFDKPSEVATATPRLLTEYMYLEMLIRKKEILEEEFWLLFCSLLICIAMENKVDANYKINSLMKIVETASQGKCSTLPILMEAIEKYENLKRAVRHFATKRNKALALNFFK